MALPADWNPVRVGGSARVGTVIVADLERVRLELNWRRVRSSARVDLSRVARAGRGGKRASLTWRSPDPAGTVAHETVASPTEHEKAVAAHFRSGRGPRASRRGQAPAPSAPEPVPFPEPPAIFEAGGGILDTRRAVADNGDVLALLASRASDRLLFVKVAGTPDRRVEPLADRILNSVADASGRASVPWCVYGFAWSVPAGFQLSGHRFAAGRATLTFRRRRQLLTFERWALAGAGGQPARGRSEPAGDSESAAGRCVSHNGHEISLAPVARRKLWHRITGGQVWRADWTCPVSNRGYRVEAGGPEAADRLEAAIRSIACHQERERSARRER